MTGKQKTTTGRDTMMRIPIIALFAIAAALLGETQISNAQSSYSYAWCAILPGAGSGSGGAMSCYYTSWEQCRTTMSGIGGLASRVHIIDARLLVRLRLSLAFH